MSAYGYERTFVKLRHYPEAPLLPDRPQGPFLANGAKPRRRKALAHQPAALSAGAPPPAGRPEARFT